MLATQPRLPDLDATIVALSSAAGPGARAIVRMSGCRAAGIAGVVCPDFDRNDIQTGTFFQGLLRLSGFAAAIPADIYHFAAPKTYTGQDIVEIHTISCQPIAEVLIAACLDAGARAAQAGEFTMRAFLAGKLDLTRAEAVLGVIEATQRQELTHALTQLAGGMTQPLHELREDLLNLLADVEAALDFAEEEVHFVSTEALLKRLARGLAYVTLLRKQIDQRSLGQRPFRIVLAGAPNAGKSSLFNTLVGQDAALVCTEPGTTRDYLEKTINLNGLTLQLVDTAGWRETGDAIESAAQTLGKDQTTHADLILWCCPSDEIEPALPDDMRDSHNYVRVLTKVDLAAPPPTGLATSAATGAGMAELREFLAEQVRRHGHSAMAPSLSRCRHHIEACLQHLRHAHALVLNEELPELLALQLRLALDELAAMAGAVYTDDLLDRIFSRFCIGK